MCGICGYVSLDIQKPVDPSFLTPMMLAIRHRGPDQSGHYVDTQAALGSRRLAIIDVPGGHQPISNACGNLWIVFNGEIYNYKELRLFLLKKGHMFKTETDTEVVLHLYEEFGSNCVDFFNGIFAFAIWDSQSRLLFIARDHIGVKPLYYAQFDNQLIFASELKALLQHPEVRARREVDLIALNEYLSYEYVPSPRTILKGVHRLEAGSRLLTSTGTVHISQYWQPDLTRSELRPPVHWQDYAQGLLHVLKSIVAQELVSDVPVGVLLSGGIDSSTIGALMAQTYAGTVKSFSIGFEEASFNESHFARQAAQHIGLEHHELILTSRLAADTVPGIMDHLDEPFGDSSFIPMFLLSRFASQHVKVVLGGDGGDELFAGYPTYKAHRLIEYYERTIPRWVRANIVPNLIAHLPTSFDNISFDFKVRRFLAGRGVPIQARHHRWLGSFVPEEKEYLLQDWIKPVLHDTYAVAYKHGKESRTRKLLNEILYTDMKMYLEGDILYKVDRASMASSLEVRVPFLNRTVVDFATQLPLDLKLHRLNGKFILKKAVSHLLPTAIVNRSKRGFNMPVAYWLTGELRDLAKDMLSSDQLGKHDFFHQAFIDGLFSDHQEKKNDNRKHLWTLLMFQMWYARYMC
ncbi:asparagine synthase (glutamine-hydrolysing) [Gammaproteobacteria bacterium]